MLHMSLWSIKDKGYIDYKILRLEFEAEILPSEALFKIAGTIGWIIIQSQYLYIYLGVGL